MERKSMTPYAELVKVFKLARAEGEDFDGYARRAVKKINACSEEQWKDLSTELQVWNNTTQEALEKQESLPLLEGWPEEEPEPVSDAADAGDSGDDGDDGEEAPEEAEPDSDEEGESEEAEPESEPEEAEPEVAAKSVKRAVVKKVTKPVKEKELEKVVVKKKVMKAAAPKAVKAAKANGNGAAKVGRASSFAPTAKIKLLVKENPHRAGSSRAKRWPKYKSGMTVAEALKAGFNFGNLHHSVADGHIKID
jgi:outer membrane biosynthesis protein TonB